MLIVKIDNKGWGLNTLLICIVIILLALVVSGYYIFVLYNSLNKQLEVVDNNTKEVIEDITPYYIDILNNMDTATINYVKDYNIPIAVDQELSINLDTLTSLNYLNNVNDKKTNNKCNGYTLIDSNYNTKSYLKCDNYTSKGYGEF